MIRSLPLLLLVAAATVPAAAQAPAGPPVAAEAAPPPTRRPVSLYADVRAYQTGDLLTVVLAERTSARRQSESSASEQRQINGSGSGSNGTFGLDARVSGSRDSDSRTVQSDLLAGTITARVIAVDPAGNLQIEGERRLNVDGAVHLMRVAGLVRPADVTTANTVLSYQIASANVVYLQEGRGPRFLRGKFLATIGLVAVIVGAVMLSGGSSNAVSAAGSIPVGE